MHTRKNKGEAKIVSFGKTDTGKLRKGNEDSFQISEGEDFVSAVVCDGMGGVHGGSVASELAVCVYTDTLFKEIGKSGEALTGQIIKSAMLTAVEAANSAVYGRASLDDELSGMGTTLVACFAWCGRAFVVNVGDSRLYRVNGGKAQQVTRDHSFVQFLLDSGRITAEEAASHPNRNVITRAVGIGEKAEADFFVEEGFDGLLLCSDGLTNYVSDAARDAVLSGGGTVKKKVNALVQAANKGGGGDNITVILLMREENNG